MFGCGAAVKAKEERITFRMKVNGTGHEGTRSPSRIAFAPDTMRHPVHTLSFYSDDGWGHA